MPPATIEQRVLALHGAAFNSGFDALLSPSGDPVRLAGLRDSVCGEVQPLLDQACAIVDAYCSASVHELRAGQRSAPAKTKRDEDTKRLTAEVCALAPYLRKEFADHLTRSTLNALIAEIASVKSLDQLLQATDPFNELSDIALSVHRQTQHITLLLEVGRALQQEGPLRAVGENLEHDVLGHYVYLRNCVVHYAADLRWDQRALSRLRHALDIEAPFIQQVVRATRAIATDSYEIAPHNPDSIVLIPATATAQRFAYQLSCNSKPIFFNNQKARRFRFM